MDRFRISVILILTLAASPARALKTGDRAPDFQLIGADGTSHSLAQYRDQVVVLEWYNKDCPFVRKFYDAERMQAWQGEATAPASRDQRSVVWLTIASSATGKQGFLSVAEAEQVRKDAKMNNTALLLDPRGVVGRQYGAKATPHVFIINRKGRIAYQGAVDDRPSAQPASLTGAEGYFLDALNAVRADRAPKIASTTAYGCPVKY